jgi:hypothetical protein
LQNGVLAAYGRQAALLRRFACFVVKKAIFRHQIGLQPFIYGRYQLLKT